MFDFNSYKPVAWICGAIISACIATNASAATLPLTVSAKSDIAGGVGAQMTVYVDGAQIGTVAVNNTA